MPGTPAPQARLRDVLIVAGILVLAGVAVADAVLGGGDSEAVTETTETEREEAFVKVPAPGSIVFLDESGCAIRRVVVASGQEQPLPRVETGCELWAAPRGARIAHSLDVPYGEFTPFRFLDLDNPELRLGTFQTLSGVTWSSDGRWASWCHESAGLTVEVGRETEPRRLDRCPLAFAPGGRPAFGEPEGLVAGGEVVVPTRGVVPTHAAWGRDRSVALLAAGLLERHVDGRMVGAAEPPDDGAAPVLAPDNCAAAFPDAEGTIALVSLCSDRQVAGAVEGTAVAWSPDGEWVATATEDEIVFHDVAGSLGVFRWPASARAIAWLR